MKRFSNKFILSLLFLCSGVVVQANVNLDSLWAVWNDERLPDSVRVQAINKITWEGYLFSKPDSAFYFAQMLYDFASEKNNKNEMARALRIQGISLYLRGQYPKALNYYDQCLNIYEDISDTSGMAKIFNNIGLIYSDQGDYFKALNYYTKSLDIKEKINDKQGAAGAMNNIGIIYKNVGNYKQAMEYYQRYFAISEEISDKNRMADALNNIGDIYMLREDYPQALDCFQRCLLIKEEISANNSIASTLNNLGYVYMKQGNYPRAMNYFERSLKIRKEIQDNRGMAITLINIGTLYNYQGQHTEALVRCKEGLQLSLDIQILENQKNACECLYNGYKALNNVSKALEYHERIDVLIDSLRAEETSQILLQTEFARQILADSLLHVEEKNKIKIAHEADVRKKKRTRNIFIFSALFFLVIILMMFSRAYFNKRVNRTIENEKARSDKLLLNILPTEIAKELKEKGKAEARKFEMVTVLFSDFTGFTQMSEQLSPEELVGEINTCFKTFDSICKKYGVEKIKTIGDAYLAAGGLPAPSKDSVKNTVLAGLEMADFILKRQDERKKVGKAYFEMRVGIHTGSVVAGIVGVTKFQYDIWGDTISAASHMERSGEVGEVNISHFTFETIKDDPIFSFQPRGKTSVKGKGEVDMWFVNLNNPEERLI